MSVLKYLDPRADTTIQADAFQKRLRAALLQDALRTLTETKQNCTDIESKTLEGSVGLEKFRSATSSMANIVSSPQITNPLSPFSEEVLPLSAEIVEASHKSL